MKNKTFKIIFFILVVLSFGLFIYKQYQSVYPKFTGATLTKVPIEDRKLGDEIATLKKMLPYTRVGFTITSYDYAKGKFVVNVTNQSNFEKWLLESEFKDIPLTSFLVLE